MTNLGLQNKFARLIDLMDTKGGSAPGLIIHRLKEVQNIIEDTYSCESTTEIQNSIDEITDAGTIFIEEGTITVSTAIDLDGSGSYIIRGHGDNSILKPDAGISVFNITDAASVRIENLKLDLSSYTANTQAIVCNETANNHVVFDNVTIVGGGTYGIGIEVQSQNVTINSCNISSVQDAIYINSSNKNLITNNTCESNARYGIYASASDYCTINGNNCNSNAQGIFVTGCDNNTISSNICNSNSVHGLHIYNSDYNTIASNTCNANDSTSASDTAGLYIDSDSDYCVVTANSSNNNNNAGAGNGYGIIIAAATCNETVVSGNNANGNDIDYKDSGTDTTLLYYVQDSTELQEAIDSIGTKTGYVKIVSGTTTLSITIDVDGGGSYFIEGDGDNSIIDINGDYSAFNITSAKSVELRNFKIDASDLTTATKEIINVTEAANNRVTIENVTITGDGTNGYGIECNSNKVRIANCDIDNVNYGIHLLGDNIRVNNCYVDSCATAGVYINGGKYNNLTDNTFTACADGVYLTTSANNNYVNGNLINANTLNGIFITGSNNNKVFNNTIDANDSSTANPQAGVYLETNCDYNIITSNIITDNNNSGGGTTYGVYIAAASCNKTIVDDNVNSGNDTTYLDEGTTTEIVYYCTSEDEIRDALTSIGVGVGTITISGTIAISSEIEIDGGGTYTIKGDGNSSTLVRPASDNLIKITSATNIIIQDIAIDSTNLGGAADICIWCIEGSNNPILLDNIFFECADTYGTCIYLESNSVTITSCRFIGYSFYTILSSAAERIMISNCSFIDSQRCISLSSLTYSIITNNILKSSINNAISLSSSSECIISNNLLYNNDCGILLYNSNYCNINGNLLSSGDSGIEIQSNSDYNNITNNNCYNNTNYGIRIVDSNCKNNYCDGNLFYNNGVNISGNTDNILQIDYLEFIGWEADNETNCTATQSYDTTERKIIFDIDATGAAASVDIICQFRVPNGFQEFLNTSTDIVVRAITDAGADRDSTITINFLDTAGTDSDDDSVSATTLTNAWANYDCAIDAGSFSPNNIVILKISLVLPDADDGVQLEIPEIKCLV